MDTPQIIQIVSSGSSLLLSILALIISAYKSAHREDRMVAVKIALLEQLSTIHTNELNKLSDKLDEVKDELREQ